MYGWVNEWEGSVCVCVCACVLFLDLFQDDLRCLFSPHQVNYGGVQKQLSLYKSQLSLYRSHTSVSVRHLHKFLAVGMSPNLALCIKDTTVVWSCPDHCTSSEVSPPPPVASSMSAAVWLSHTLLAVFSRAAFLLSGTAWSVSAVLIRQSCSHFLLNSLIMCQMTKRARRSHVSWMGLGKSRHPMRNSRLLFLVRLSFTTSTKYCTTSHFLRPRRGCYLCVVHQISHLWSSYSHIFHAWIQTSHSQICVVPVCLLHPLPYSQVHVYHWYAQVSQSRKTRSSQIFMTWQTVTGGE